MYKRQKLYLYLYYKKFFCSALGWVKKNKYVAYVVQFDLIVNASKGTTIASRLSVCLELVIGLIWSRAKGFIATKTTTDISYVRTLTELAPNGPTGIYALLCHSHIRWSPIYLLFLNLRLAGSHQCSPCVELVRSKGEIHLSIDQNLVSIISHIQDCNWD